MSEGFKIVTQEYLLKLFQPKSLAILFAMVLLIVILIVISKKTAYNAKVLTYGAIAISIAFVLSYIRIFKMPNGGTVTLASMLPIFIFAYIAGPRAGMLAGLCYGMLQFIQDPYIVHPVQFLLDYPVGFAVLGLSGLFKERIFFGALLGGTSRFICHFLTGVIYFGSYASPGQSVFAYSFLYNISYMLPDMIICIGILMVGSVRSAITRIKFSI